MSTSEKGIDISLDALGEARKRAGIDGTLHFLIFPTRLFPIVRADMSLS